METFQKGFQEHFSPLLHQFPKPFKIETCKWEQNVFLKFANCVKNKKLADMFLRTSIKHSMDKIGKESKAKQQAESF